MRPERERPERLEVAEAAQVAGVAEHGGRDDRPHDELRRVRRERHRADGAQGQHDPRQHACGTTQQARADHASAKPPEPITSSTPLECARAVHTAPQSDVELGGLVGAGRGIQPVAGEREDERRLRPSTAGRGRRMPARATPSPARTNAIHTGNG